MSVLDYYRPKTKRRLMNGEHVAWVHRNARASYIRQCVLSFPEWVDREALRQIWEEARSLEAATGEPHVIDHIVPLTHPNVCGLSVPWNMRAVPRRVNARKSNKWCVDQLCLFWEEDDANP